MQFLYKKEEEVIVKIIKEDWCIEYSDGTAGFGARENTLRRLQDTLHTFHGSKCLTNLKEALRGNPNRTENIRYEGDVTILEDTYTTPQCVVKHTLCYKHIEEEETN